MKTTLTPEQSATLIAKGISADKASVCQLYSDYDGEIIDPSEVYEDCGKLLAVVNDEAIEVDRNIVSKDSDFDHSFADDMPIFTLADILSIIPKEINILEDHYCLVMKAADCSSTVYYGNQLERFSPYVSADELIDALYELLLWVIDKGFAYLTK